MNMSKSNGQKENEERNYKVYVHTNKTNNVEKTNNKLLYFSSIWCYYPSIKQIFGGNCYGKRKKENR